MTSENDFVVYRNPKLFIYDLEVGPMAGTSYESYDTNMLDILEQKYILCYAFAWFDFDNPYKKPKVYARSLVDSPARFKNNPFDDYDLAVNLNREMLKADWLSAYNGKKFDDRMANTRFVKHGLDFIDDVIIKMIDPMRTVKRVLALERNNLDYVSKFLGNEGKTAVTHADVRKECTQIENWWHHRPIEIDKKAWKLMVDYCKQDVVAAYEAYRDTRRFDRTHPNVGIYKGVPCCPTCGSEHLQSEKIRSNTTMRYRQFVCQSCKARPRERLADPDLQNKPEYVN